MLEKLFESLDEKVFTPKLKNDLQERFDEAVTATAQSLLDERIDEEVKELERKNAEYLEKINEEYEKKLAAEKSRMADALDRYAERVVNDFITEAHDSMEASLVNEHAEMITNAFTSMMIATGVKVADIASARESGSDGAKLDEAAKKYDRVVEENIRLREENEALLKEGIISELSEGLTAIEAKKFSTMASLVPFTRDKSYVAALGNVKNSVLGTVQEPPKKSLNENKEVKKNGNLVIPAHLI